MTESITKMNNQTVLVLRAISKEQDLGGYYKLKKANLISLLSTQSTQEMQIPSSRTRKHKRKSFHTIKIISHSEKMKKWKKMAKEKGRQGKSRTNRRSSQFNTSGKKDGTERSLQKLCAALIIK